MAARRKTHAFGYAQALAGGPDLKAQLAALAEAGILENLLISDAGTSKDGRPGLRRLLVEAGRGDTLSVCLLAVLGSELTAILKCLGELANKGVTLHALSDGIDTGGPHADALLALLDALRRVDGAARKAVHRRSLADAKAKGRISGRPQIYSDEKIREALAAVERGATIEAAAKLVTSADGKCITTTRLRDRFKQL